MEETVGAGRLAGNEDRRTCNGNTIDRFETIAPASISPRDTPFRIVRRRRYDANLMTKGNKRLAQLRVVFCHADQVGSVIDADNKNAHTIRPRPAGGRPIKSALRRWRTGSAAACQGHPSSRYIPAVRTRPGRGF